MIDWSAFLLASLLVSIVPGANQLLSLRNAARQGAADASVALVGRFLAFAILMTLTAAGLGAVLVASAAAFAIVRWAGVVYLAWLGVSLLWSSRTAPGESPDDDADGRRGRWTLVRQEFMVAITNPKALLLFAAFIPQFAPATGASWESLALLGSAYIGVEAVSALAYALVGGRLRATGLTRALRRRLDQVSGLVFLGLASALALERRPT